MQSKNSDEASRNQTTTRKVGNKNLRLTNSVRNSGNWIQPMNDRFPILQPKAIMANPQEGDMDCKQALQLEENIRRPTNDSCGVHYFVE